jgi:hypothetical protein
MKELARVHSSRISFLYGSMDLLIYRLTGVKQQYTWSRFVEFEISKIVYETVSLIRAPWWADKSFRRFRSTSTSIKTIILNLEKRSKMGISEKSEKFLKPTLPYLPIYRLRVSLRDPSLNDGWRRPAYGAVSQVMGPSMERELNWFSLDRGITIFIMAAPKSHSWTRRLQYQLLFLQNVIEVSL